MCEEKLVIGEEINKYLEYLGFKKLNSSYYISVSDKVVYINVLRNTIGYKNYTTDDYKVCDMVNGVNDQYHLINKYVLECDNSDLKIKVRKHKIKQILE